MYDYSGQRDFRGSRKKEEKKRNLKREGFHNTPRQQITKSTPPTLGINPKSQKIAHEMK